MDRKEGLEELESPLIPYSQEKCNETTLEIKKHFYLSAPLVISNLLIYSLQVISVMFVGHLGELALSSSSIATSFVSVTGFNLLTGMASALDTFCGQSYGAKQYHMLGVYMQRAMIVLLVVTIPMAIVWANTGSILKLLRQDPEISMEAGQYARFMIPSIFAYALLQCHIRFLQAQNVVFPMMLSAGITTLLHIIICWVLVFKSGLGYKGAALANAISYWLNFFFLAIYVKFSPSCKNTWNGFSKEALYDLPKFLKLAIPSAAMLCLEVWSFEMMVLLSGLLPNPKLETSVLSISYNTNTMVYMIPLGLSSAISIRVSNELGAGRANAARLAACIVVLLVTTEGSLAAMIMIMGRKVWGHCYSHDENILNYIAKMLILVAGSHFLDGIQSVLSGIIRGCGWQKIGAVVNLGAYYLIGLPSGVVLAFVYHFGGKGLWIGLIAALFTHSLFLMIVVLRIDWDKEAKKAAQRVQCTAIPIVNS